MPGIISQSSYNISIWAFSWDSAHSHETHSEARTPNATKLVDTDSTLSKKVSNKKGRDNPKSKKAPRSRVVTQQRLKIQAPFIWGSLCLAFRETIIFIPNFAESRTQSQEKKANTITRSTLFIDLLS